MSFIFHHSRNHHTSKCMVTYKSPVQDVWDTWLQTNLWEENQIRVTHKMYVRGQS